MQLETILSGIRPANRDAADAARRRWDSIAKPLHGMGLLEEMLARIAGITGSPTVDIRKKCVAVFCADNGVVAEGVTQTGSEVTAIVAANMTRGQATVTNMARVAGADVFVYDAGMLSDVPGTRRVKTARGTHNLLEQPAMSRAEAERLLVVGTEAVRSLRDEGYRLIATGEMGIGNTTTSSAVASVLLGLDPRNVAGRGAGLSAEGVRHKAEVIAAAISRRRPDPADPVDVLAKVGGFDLAGLCGVFLGGAYYRVPILIDGLISSVAALAAHRLCPAAGDCMLASHLSAEPAAARILSELGLAAPLTCGMALGEGTGAVALMPLLDMAEAVYRHMPSFGEIDVEAYQPL